MGYFVQSAKEAYNMKTSEEKASLYQKALEDDGREHVVVLTDHRIGVEGDRIFKKIKNLVSQILIQALEYIVSR